MGIELSASRLLAPFFGASIFVWTNIIGIVLISLSIGYYIGGKYADKHPKEKFFYLFSLIAGILIGLIPIISSLILPNAIQALSNTSYNDFLLSFTGSLLLFAFPTAFLGAIVPFAVRINAKKVDRIGKTSGNIYALSTIGSIIGVYLPALVLIPAIGTRFTIILFSVLLIIISTIGFLFTFSKKLLKKTIIIIFISVFLIFSIIFIPKTISIDENAVYESESSYNYLQVLKIKDTTYLRGKLTGGIWSKKIIGREFSEGYWDYPVVASVFNKNSIKDVLILGLAAGSTARSFFGAIPNVEIDGVEIDPLVVEIGKKYFDMNFENLNTIITDGRLFVKTTQNNYDIIVVDVFRDSYIPPHMVTVEFFNEIKSILNQNGTLSITVVAKENDFIDYLANTILQVFPNVYTLKIPNTQNYLLFGSLNDFMLEDLKKLILDSRDKIQFSPNCLEEDKLSLKIAFTETYTNIRDFSSKNNLFFTDDNAPVEHIYGINVFYPFN